MANVTGELKKIFSCENLKKCFDTGTGMRGYLEGLKKDIEEFLTQSKKMRAKDHTNSDTCNNFKKFADILSGYIKKSGDDDFNKICKAADLLPKYVLDENGKKICTISFKASIKKST